MKQPTQQNYYGTASQKVRATICPELQDVFDEALQFFDHALFSGARSEEEQNQMLEDGKTELAWPNSKHNVGPEAGRELSYAVDVVLYHEKYGAIWCTPKEAVTIAKDFDTKPHRAMFWMQMQYARFHERVLTIAERKGIKLRWGGDWNGENGILDQDFDDYFHWEIVRD